MARWAAWCAVLSFLVCCFLICGAVNDIDHLATTSHSSGVAMLNQGRFSQSIRCFRLCVRSSPHRVEWRNNLAVALVSAYRMDEHDHLLLQECWMHVRAIYHSSSLDPLYAYNAAQTAADAGQWGISLCLLRQMAAVERVDNKDWFNIYTNIVRSAVYEGVMATKEVCRGCEEYASPSYCLTVTGVHVCDVCVALQYIEHVLPSHSLSSRDRILLSSMTSRLRGEDAISCSFIEMISARDWMSFYRQEVTPCQVA